MKGQQKRFSLDTPRCPRLTVLKINSAQGLNEEVVTFLKRHLDIRVIRLNEGYTYQDLAGSLPKVTKVTASGKLGRFFFARPELTEYHQHPNDSIGSVRELWSWLEQAQRSQLHPPPLEQLRVAILSKAYDLGALPVLSYFFGSTLRNLHIWIEKNSRCRSPRSFSYLLSDWTTLIGPGVYSGSQATEGFAHLRSIRVSFKIMKGIEFPETTCRRLLRDKSFLFAQYWRRHYLQQCLLTKRLSERNLKMEWSYELGRTAADGASHFRISFQDLGFSYEPVAGRPLVM